jgi:GNAT superfamily N-acetyltransferase
VTVKFRSLDKQDKTQWLSLWKGYNDFYGSELADEVTEYTWTRLLDPASSMFCRVAVLDGTVVGFAHCVLHEGTWVTSQMCYLEDLFVDPAWRGKGVARQLIQFVLNEAKEQGWSRFYWHTRIHNPARKLYDEFVAADDFVRYCVSL